MARISKDIELQVVALYHDVTNHELAARFGISESTVQRIRRDYDLKKSNSGCYPKRWIPWNKGKSIDVHKNAIATQFKAGHEPVNTLHDYAITLRHPHKYRGGRQYYFIRLAKGKWEHLHRYLWKQVHGSIPKGKLIVFKNGDTLDCLMDNLEMISMAENVKRNRNPEKAGLSLKNLSDNYVAGLLKRTLKVPRKEILALHQDMVKAKRLQLQLKRKIYENQRA
jgi:hypothetical protein